MRFLTVLHRWLGIFVCLLFAMWFASGIVMHFVPFPSLTEADRIAGLAPLEMVHVLHGPADAAQVGGKDVTRVRLLRRSDGPVYVTFGSSGLGAFRADDLRSAALTSEHLAVAIAVDHARRRGMDVTQAAFADLVDFDQWTVTGDLNRHRPLYRIALNDEPGTELYVSSVTGEVVRDTTRFERRWNYIGSVVHWIYPVVLRSRPAIWSATVWTLSFVALIAAIAGSLLGLLRVERRHAFVCRRLIPNWHWWHHMLGLLCMTFVLSWIFSGWLSMDSGQLFSTGRPTTPEEKAIISAAPAWETMSAHERWPVTARSQRNRMVRLRSEILPARADQCRDASSYSQMPAPTQRSRRRSSSIRARSDRRSNVSRRVAKRRSSSMLVIIMRSPRRRRMHRSTVRYAATSGFTSTAPMARCWSGRIPRGVPIAGSTARCIRWIFQR